VEFAKALLDAGVDIDPINVWGNTPLWVAIMERHLSRPDGSMIRLLLDHGANPNRGEGNNTPVELTRMIAGFPEDLVQLLEEKARTT
jgi:ankyrin repeat protein